MPLWGMLIISIFVFSGCLKDGDDTIVLPIPNGKIPYDVIPERLQDSLRVHGFEINEGIEPPMIVGTYLLSPLDLKYASDNYLNLFYDLTMTISGQHVRGRVHYEEMQNNEAHGMDTIANVIGTDSTFSMYCIQNISDTNSRGELLWRCKVATVVSGAISPEGIKKCQYAYVLRDKWARNDYYASRLPEVGTFRYWDDGDSLAVKLNK